MRLFIDSCGFYQKCIDRFGDPCSINTPYGVLIVTGDPEGVRQIYAADPDTFEIFAADTVTPFLGRNSLMVSSGPGHRHARRFMLPPFHGKRMRVHAERMVEATHEVLGRVGPQPVIAQELMTELSFEVILPVVFGADMRDCRELRATLTEAQASISPAIIFLFFMRHAMRKRGPWARFVRATQALDEVVLQLIAQARRDGKAGDDVLSTLLEAKDEHNLPLSDQAIRDHLVSLVVAGHETLASALAWCLYWLHENPGAAAKLREEIGDERDVDVIAKLAYLDAVCSETLRLSPILPEATRLLRRPMTLLGHELPAGVAVASIATVTHMRPDIYSAPERFSPERFLTRKFSQFEFIPFGGGTHRCLGAAFAIYEMKLVLATLVRDFELVVRPADRVFASRHSVPFGPNRTVSLEVHGRRGC